MKQKTKEPIEDIEEVLRFDTTTEAKLLTKLNKILDAETMTITEEEAVKRDELFIMDLANVVMVIAKTEQAKRILSRYLTKDNVDPSYEIPKLNYFIENGRKEDNNKLMCRYSTEYLKKIIDFFSVLDESTQLNLKNEYPLTLENKHFEVILAPRITEDW